MTDQGWAGEIVNESKEHASIRRHFKGLKKRADYRNGPALPGVWLTLARHWKRPVREIKNIVGYHGRTDW